MGRFLPDRTELELTFPRLLGYRNGLPTAHLTRSPPSGNDDDLPCRFAFIKDTVGFAGFFKREAVSDAPLRVNVLAHEEFQKVLHLAQAGYPRTLERELMVDEGAARCESHLAALADEDDASPLAGRLKA